MKEFITEFFVNKFYSAQNEKDFDLDIIPAILRRRMSLLDKCTLSAMNRVFLPEPEYMVFSSRFGEVERLVKIIGQYTSLKEVSPNTFSCSVHNFPVGFFLLNRQKPIPYTALSSCNHSLSFGLLSAVTSKYNNILFCFADSNKGENISVALNISKTPDDNSVKYLIKSKPYSENDASFEDFIKLFDGKVHNIQTTSYSIERID